MEDSHLGASEPKVFCIGFHKTGTTTFGQAMSQLGYTVCGTQLHLAALLRRSNYDEALALAANHDAFRDNPWPMLYQLCDEHFPGSKFVLTTRSPDGWIKSVTTHFGTSDTEMRQWIYGVGHPVGHENTYLRRYKSHNESVREYFHGRSSQFAELSWEKGDGWDKLCDFVGKVIPNRPFPHGNIGAGRKFIDDAAGPTKVK
jgi:hypothetical protein